MTTFDGPSPPRPSKVGGDRNPLGDRAEVQYRQAGAGDIEAVAGLHADSWRRHYRGAYLDSFLDGDVFADRVVVWGERLSESTSDSVTVVAVKDEAVVGFAHTIFDDDPVCGARLDNLHVAYALKGHGVGTGLMAQTASALIQARPKSGLYLWVLEQNSAAQAFYEARGGTRAGQRLGGPFPGGGRAVTLRYVWPDPSILLAPP